MDIIAELWDVLAPEAQHHTLRSVNKLSTSTTSGPVLLFLTVYLLFLNSKSLILYFLRESTTLDVVYSNKINLHQQLFQLFIFYIISA